MLEKDREQDERQEKQKDDNFQIVYGASCLIVSLRHCGSGRGSWPSNTATATDNSDSSAATSTAAAAAVVGRRWNVGCGTCDSCCCCRLHHFHQQQIY